jgi:hypothetical protein
LGLDVPLENIGLAATTGKLPATSPQANRAGLTSAAFFSAFGLLRARKSDDIDFLNITRAQSKKTAANIAALSVLTVISLFIMALEPFMLLWKSSQLELDQKALSNSAYSEIKSLVDKQNSLSSQVAAAESERSMLPYGKSKSEEITKQLFDQVASKASAVNTCALDNTTGSVTLAFTVSGYNNYLDIKHTVESNNYFTVAVPFTVSTQDGKSYACNVVLNVKNFTPFGTESKGGAAK